MRERASIVGGTVSVTSRPGGGTRVSASIPLHGDAAPSAAAAPPAGAEPGRVTITGAPAQPARRRG